MVRKGGVPPTIVGALFMKRRAEINIPGGSQIDRMYHNVVSNVDPEDWRKIRDERYWKERDALRSDKEKKRYSINRILAWKKKNK